MTESQPVPYRGFLSYYRDDNTAFDGIVDRIKRDLQARFAAATGTELHLFLDRADIGWGEQWRQSLSDAIAGSTLFIPIITLRYFQRQACREELQAFYDAALRLNAVDLILPIIIVGGDRVRTDSEDELVAIVANCNYEDVGPAWEEGYGSAAWRQAIGRLINGLQNALQRAEPALLNNTARLTPPTPRDPTAPPSVVVDGLEVDEAMIEESIERVGEDLTATSEALELVGKAFEERTAGRDVSSLSSGQRTFFLGALAQDLKEPAEQFNELAQKLELQVIELDTNLRAFVDELRSVNPVLAESQVPELEGLIQASVSSIQEVVDQAPEILTILRTMALSSVALRRALRPLTSGIQSFEAASSMLLSLSRLH